MSTIVRGPARRTRSETLLKAEASALHQQLTPKDAVKVHLTLGFLKMALT